MSATLGVDYAFHHPDPAAIVASGYRFVMRYLSNDPSKDLSAAELAELRGVGLAVGVVWETTATRALAGRDAGVADANTARARMRALGFDPSIPCYFAIDFSAESGAIRPYVSGVRDTIPLRWGLYCSAAVAVALFPPFVWQTEAWSGTTVEPGIELYQRIRPTLPPIAGGGYDENVALRPLAECGLWLPGTPAPAPAPGAPPARPAPAPVPVRLPHPGVIVMPQLVTGSKGMPVRILQGLLNAWGLRVTIDGDYGPATTSAVRACQLAHRLGVDGKVGPQTWSLLLGTRVA